MRIFLKVLYWLAVLAISLALVIGLILWFEAQDASEIENSGGAVPAIMPA
jgi:cytochrome b subunit of formate dehydrogenase